MKERDPNNKRIFIALPVPDSIKNKISALRTDFPDVKWTPPENTHITLKFLGSTSPDMVKQIGVALDSIRCKKFSVRMEGAGYFSQGVLWLGVKPSEDLLTLKETIDETVLDYGFGTRDTPYKPHVTIARTKKSMNTEMVRIFLDHVCNFSTQDFIPEHFHLYESVSSETGVRYHVLKSYKLF